MNTKKVEKEAKPVEEVTTNQPDNRKDYMTGQKYQTPEEGDSLRIFYESLLRQRPESKLAEKWILEHGLCTSEA